MTILRSVYNDFTINPKIFQGVISKAGKNHLTKKGYLLQKNHTY